MDNNMMMQMMQLMMQNNQLMSQMMMQTMQGQPSQIAAPTLTIQENSKSSTEAELLAQIEALKQELELTKAELAGTKQTLEATQKALEYNREQTSTDTSELMNLKKTVSQAEAYLGKKIEDIAEEGAKLGGDDYYEEHKKEWNEEGISNKEKHDRISSYRKLFSEENGNNFMIEF